MRELTSHKVNGLNEALKIIVTDEPGPGGAHHFYDIVMPDGGRLPILFQKGPIAEAGVNGISGEALLAIVEDRLNCFQKGAYACHENAFALDHVRAAIAQLHARTMTRIAFGIEGTSQK